jgi:hypothetical protein
MGGEGRPAQGERGRGSQVWEGERGAVKKGQKGESEREMYPWAISIMFW